MTRISNNEIARAIYLISKDKNPSGQVEVSKKVAKFLFRKRLLSKAPDILARLKNIINIEESRIDAKVTSAELLNHQTKARLENFLKKRYSAKEITFTENVNSELIGGLRIQVNNEIIDTSIKSKIGKLQEHLIKSA